jgi:hypothetical protein
MLPLKQQNITVSHCYTIIFLKFTQVGEQTRDLFHSLFILYHCSAGPQRLPEYILPLRQQNITVSHCYTIILLKITKVGQQTRNLFHCSFIFYHCSSELQRLPEHILPLRQQNNTVSHHYKIIFLKFIWVGEQTWDFFCCSFNFYHYSAELQSLP